MNTKELLKNLHAQGIRRIEMKWSCGGDDGSIESITYFPPDRHPTGEETNQLRDIAWDVYTDEYGGYTAGEFHADGGVDVIVEKDGSYKANSSNDYSEDEYDEETDSYQDVNETSDNRKNINLRE